jgi:hypothetical protein
MAEAADAWTKHSREQLLRWARLTPQQKLDWLWQAKLFAAKARQQALLRRKKPSALR